MFTIEPGTKFSTECESGCTAITSPDSEGTFIATDSDGVECLFNTVMISEVL